MKRFSLHLLSLIALALSGTTFGMDNPDDNSKFRIIRTDDAKLIAHTAITQQLALWEPNMTPEVRRAALQEINNQIGQRAAQGTIAIPQLREIMMNVAQTKHINEEAMTISFRTVLAQAEGRKATAPRAKSTNNPGEPKANASTRFHNTYGSIILLDKSLKHFPVVHIRCNQQGRDRTCGFRAVTNARAVDFLVDANRPVSSEAVCKEATEAANGLQDTLKEDLASDELRNLANQANVHNFYILDAQAYGRDRNYQVTLGDTENGINADPLVTVQNLEMELQNIGRMDADQSSTIHFFCNLAQKNARGAYNDGHWILISIVKEAHRPAVIVYQDSGNNVVRPNSLNHLYLYEVIALCHRHAGLFANVDVTNTLIDRARGIADANEDVLAWEDDRNGDNKDDCVIC